MATRQAPDRRRPSNREVARRGRSALVVSLIGVVISVFGARTLGVAPGFQPLSYGPAVLFTVLGVVGATLVYALLWRVMDTPNRAFTMIAAVALVLSWIPDVVIAPALPGATTPGIVQLVVLHLLVAVVTVAFLTGKIS